MTPYYEHGGITIYHGDCREILPSLRADALVTDPPYGLQLGARQTVRGIDDGLAKESYASYEDSPDNFRAVVVPAIDAALKVVKRGLVFASYFGLQNLPPYDAVGGVFIPMCIARHRWGFNNFQHCALYGTAPNLHLGARMSGITSTESAYANGHPCPKPYGWMTWAVQLASLQGEAVLDPFCGSGTTLEAAKNLGRRAIGIEIEERYCEIAAKRLAQEVLPLGEAI